MSQRQTLSVALLCLFAWSVAAQQQPAPAAKPDASKMPHVSVDVKKKQLRIDCEALKPEMALEFFCVMSGTAEHEAILRSPALGSHIHLGLLMLGLTPGEPVRFSKAADKWLPPHGPPLQIFCEWIDQAKGGVRIPAYRMMRNVKSKREMPAMTWIFAGSRVMEDGKYAADTTGYLVSVVNFDLTVIDIPELASNANETLEWELNPDTCPPKGTRVTMVIEPAGDKQPAKPKADAGATPAQVLAADAHETPAVTPPATKSDAPGALSDVQIDEQKVKALRSKWEQIVRPRGNALQEAAKAHYEVLAALRREQNRLIDEADRVQRVIDQLQKEYQDMTTPRPEGESGQTTPDAGK
jgi:hypothetical protein